VNLTALTSTPTLSLSPFSFVAFTGVVGSAPGSSGGLDAVLFRGGMVRVKMRIRLRWMVWVRQDGRFTMPITLSLFSALDV
jgi:hypothetical protein